MKKELIGCVIAAACLTSCLAPMQMAQPGTTSTPNRTTTTQPQPQTPAANNQNGSLASILGNIISSVTGDLTTTQANLVGTWVYSSPAVQFESENLLTQAGGAAAAAKVEEKLTSYYQMVGITPGSVTFAFDNAGNVQYSFGARTFTGTYVFDNASKTISITLPTGHSIKAYVTVGITQMSLCFDSTKALQLFSSISKSYNKNLSDIADTYSGMKTGFKFARQ